MVHTQALRNRTFLYKNTKYSSSYNHNVEAVMLSIERSVLLFLPVEEAVFVLFYLLKKTVSQHMEQFFVDILLFPIVYQSRNKYIYIYIYIYTVESVIKAQTYNRYKLVKHCK